MRLVQNKFAAWLRTKPPAGIVGHNRDCHACPIALYYQEASRGCEIVIFDRWGEHFIDRGYSQRRLPAWAEDFVCTVDGDDDGQITAARALEVLEARP